jgi:alpha-tubulin suppressor-like RCC1 family protein
MALNFPLNPTVGQTYQTGSSATYEFTNDQYWKVTQPSSLQIVFATTASFATSSSFAITSSFLQYAPNTNEIHVSTVEGVDALGRGTLLYPYKTINYALTRIGSTASVRLIIHRGQYAEDLNLTATNMHLVGYNAGNGSAVEINGTVTVAAASSSTKISNIRVNALRHTGAGTLFVDQVTCTTSASFASSYAEVIDSRFECSSGISQTAGTLLVFGSTFSPLTTSGSAAVSYLKDNIGVVQPTLTAGTLVIVNCQVFSAVSGSPAINTSAGTLLNLVNTNITTPTGVPTKINVGGFLSYDGIVFEKPGSTLGTQVAQTARFQSIDADFVQVTGSISVTSSTPGSNIFGTASWATDVVNGGGGGMKEITKVSITGVGGALILAEGKLYNVKGSDGGAASYHGAIYPNSFQSGLLRGIQNAYEIVFPDESSTALIVDADTYGGSAYALFDNGNLYTWGYNANGQLGLGNTTDRYYPVLAQTNVTNVYTHPSNISGDFAGARLITKRTDGKIYGCGYNQQGQLGLGNTANVSSSVELPWAGTNPISVWNLGNTGGALIIQKSDAQVWVAGDNTSGQLGNGGTTNITTAVQVAAWLGGNSNNRISTVVGGIRYQDSGGGTNGNAFISMLLRDTDTGATSILSSGYNAQGSVGNGSTTNVTVPTAPGLGPYTNIVDYAGVGGNFTSLYMINDVGEIRAWGYNGYGQLGIGSTSNITVPIQSNLLTHTEIIPINQGHWRVANQTTSPIVRRADGYYIAGFNTYAGSGTGLITNNLTTFQKIRLPQSVEIKLLGQYVWINERAIYIAVDNDNQLWVWGDNGANGIDAVDADLFFQPICVRPTALQK